MRLGIILRSSEEYDRKKASNIMTKAIENAARKFYKTPSAEVKKYESRETLAVYTEVPEKSFPSIQGLLYELDRDIYIPFVEDENLNKVLINGDYSFLIGKKAIEGLSGYFVARKVCIDERDVKNSKEYSEKIREILSNYGLK